MSLLQDIQNILNVDPNSFDNFYCHVYAKDKQGKYIYANSFLIDNAGFLKESDMLGLCDYDLSFLSDGEAEGFRANDEIVIKNNISKVCIEPGTLFDKRRVIFISHKKPLRTHSKKIIGVTGISFILDRDEFYSGVIPNTHFQLQTTVEKNTVETLTRRQIDCLYYLTKGMTAKQIAIQLKISQRTVEQHFETIKIKLNCKQRAELIAKALRMPMIRENL